MLLPDDGVWSYQLNFDVTGHWDFTRSEDGENNNDITWGGGQNGFGKDSPYSKVLLTDPDDGNYYQDTWIKDANLPDSDELIILCDDKDFGGNPLDNGFLLRLTYPDSVTLDLGFYSFLSKVDLTTQLDMLPSSTTFESGDNTLTFAPVPIPSTLLLLGGGICALLGIGRRRYRW